MALKCKLKLDDPTPLVENSIYVLCSVTYTTYTSDDEPDIDILKIFNTNEEAKKEADLIFSHEGYKVDDQKWTDSECLSHRKVEHSSIFHLYCIQRIERINKI